MQFLVMDPSAVGKLELGVHLRNDLAAGADDVLHVERADGPAADFDKELGDFCGPPAGTQVRDIGLLGVVTWPDVPGHILGELIKNRRDIAASERGVNLGNGGGRRTAAAFGAAALVSVVSVLVTACSFGCSHGRSNTQGA